MNNNFFLKGSILTLAAVCTINSFPVTAESFEYHTKEINAYDHNGNLVSSHLAPDVQYIEVVDSRIHPEKFIVSRNGVTATFSMIPVIGTSSFKLRSSLIQWPEEEKVSKIKTFYIGQTEVTNALWKAVMGSSPSAGNKEDNFPVNSVSWNDICKPDGFLDKLNELLKDQLGGMEFCLPSEAEWEFAAGGGTLRDAYTYSGSNSLDDVAWHSGNADGATHEIKTKLPNGLGAYDMTGNVSEWCSSVYRDPETGEYSANERCTRGAAYVSSGLTLYVINRGHQDANTTNRAIGLRLALKKNENKSETFSVTGADGNKVEFTMIPLAGTRSYRLQSTIITWDEEERCASIKPFSIGETEVTNALWKAVMGSLPSSGNKDDNFPVNTVSWEDICKSDGFLDRLNAQLKDKLNGRKFQLPSEWEWEFAANSGNRHDEFIYSGSNNLDEVAWHSGNADGATHEVATKRPNSLGAYDMTGNVSEWCSSVYRNPETGEYLADDRCTRGASYSPTLNSDEGSTVYYLRRRSHHPADTKYSSIGLRLILK